MWLRVAGIDAAHSRQPFKLYINYDRRRFYSLAMAVKATVDDAVVCRIQRHKK